MAGQLTIDTLKASSGVLATQNGMTGIAKAWVQFAGASGTINGSFNVSSVTRNATGYYTVNITTAMPNANYSAIASASANSGGNLPTVDTFGINSGSFYQAPTTSSFTIYTTNLSATAIDPVYVNVAVLSS